MSDKTIEVDLGIDPKPMSADEYRAALKRLGWSQAAAGRVLHFSYKTSKRYATGTPIPQTTAFLIRVLVDMEDWRRRQKALYARRPRPLESRKS